MGRRVIAVLLAAFIALVGAVQYYDAKVDDARHTMEIARTAASYGAHVATRVAAVGFIRQGERVTGVRALDKVTGREFDILARQVVNAMREQGVLISAAGPLENVLKIRPLLAFEQEHAHLLLEAVGTALEGLQP